MRDEERSGSLPVYSVQVTETDRARLNPNSISGMGLVPLFRTDQSLERTSLAMRKREDEASTEKEARKGDPLHPVLPLLETARR